MVTRQLIKVPSDFAVEGQYPQRGPTSACTRSPYKIPRPSGRASLKGASPSSRGGTASFEQDFAGPLCAGSGQQAQRRLLTRARLNVEAQWPVTVLKVRQ